MPWMRLQIQVQNVMCRIFEVWQDPPKSGTTREQLQIPDYYSRWQGVGVLLPAFFACPVRGACAAKLGEPGKSCTGGWYITLWTYSSRAPSRRFSSSIAFAHYSGHTHPHGTSKTIKRSDRNDGNKTQHPNPAYCNRLRKQDEESSFWRENHDKLRGRWYSLSEALQ